MALTPPPETVEIRGIRSSLSGVAALVRTSHTEEAVVFPSSADLLPDPGEIAWYYQEYLCFPEGGNVVRGERISQALRAVGVHLGDALAVAAPRAWSRLEGASVRAAGITLRVVSESAEADDILHLPWETLAIRGKIPVIEGGLTVDRRVLGAETVQETRAERQLHALLVVARPRDQKFIDTGSTPGAIVEALAGADAITVQLASDGTVEGMARALSAAHKAGRPYDVVHFDGHGGVGRRGPALCFESETGRTALLPASVFGALLVQTGVSGAILDACQTAEQSPIGGAFAPSLVREGLDWAIGMANVAHAHLTATFFRGFYRALLLGLPVPEATRAGHRAAFDERRRPGAIGASAEMEDWFLPRSFVGPRHRAPLVPTAARTPASTSPPPPPRPDVDLAISDGRLVHQLLREIRGVRVSVLDGLMGSGMAARAGEIAHWAHHLGMFPGGVRVCEGVGDLLGPGAAVVQSSYPSGPALVVFNGVRREDVPGVQSWLAATPADVHLLATTDDGDLGLTASQGSLYPLKPWRMAGFVYRRTGLVVAEGSQRWLCLEQTGGHLGAIDWLCGLWRSGQEAGSPAFLLDAGPPQDLLLSLAERIEAMPSEFADGVAAVATIGSIASGWYFADVCERVGVRWVEVGAWLGRWGLARRTWEAAVGDKPVMEGLSWIHPWLRYIVPLSDRARRAFLAATVKHALEMRRDAWSQEQQGIPDFYGRFLLATLPRAIGVAFEGGDREEGEELSRCLVDQLRDRGMDPLAASVGAWAQALGDRLTQPSRNALYWRLEQVERTLERDRLAGLDLARALVEDLGAEDSLPVLNARRLYARALVEGQQDYEGALAILAEAEAMARRLGGGAHLADVFSDALLVCQSAGQHAAGLEFSDRALGLYEEHGPSDRIPIARCHRAWCLMGLGRHGEAVHETTRALQEMDDARMDWGRIMALGFRSAALEELAAFDLARLDRLEGLRLERGRGDGRREVNSLAAMGLLERRAGDEAAASVWYAEAIRRAQELGLDVLITRLERWRDDHE